VDRLAVLEAKFLGQLGRAAAVHLDGQFPEFTHHLVDLSLYFILRHAGLNRHPAVTALQSQIGQSFAFKFLAASIWNDDIGGHAHFMKYALLLLLAIYVTDIDAQAAPRAQLLKLPPAPVISTRAAQEVRRGKLVKMPAVPIIWTREQYRLVPLGSPYSYNQHIYIKHYADVLPGEVYLTQDGEAHFKDPYPDPTPTPVPAPTPRPALRPAVTQPPDQANPELGFFIIAGGLGLGFCFIRMLPSHQARDSKPRNRVTLNCCP
jgi:hypothetical protein